MSDDKPLSRKEQLARINSEQLNLDLFALDPLIDRDFSNTLEIYDLAGKYIYDRNKKFLTSASADETEFTRTTVYDNMELDVSVTAANIERTTKSGKRERVFVFPGSREEAIEDVLRKMATERRAEAYHDKSSGGRFVGISFSLYELYKELRRIGRSYSYPEIREGLHIMNRSILEIRSSDNSIDLSAPFFPMMQIADRSGGTGADTRSFVCFHPMVTDAITTLNFRRFHYTKAYELPSPYTRLTFKRLCHRWIQAAPGKPYQILLTTLVASMKTPAAQLKHDTEAFKKVMTELVDAGVLESFEMIPRKDGRRIVDQKFVLHASEAFAKQMAANNKVAAAIGSADAPDDVADVEHELPLAGDDQWKEPEF